MSRSTPSGADRHAGDPPRLGVGVEQLEDAAGHVDLDSRRDRGCRRRDGVEPGTADQEDVGERGRRGVEVEPAVGLDQAAQLHRREDRPGRLQRQLLEGSQAVPDRVWRGGC